MQVKDITLSVISGFNITSRVVIACVRNHFTRSDCVCTHACIVQSCACG
jgi:hypothetical protein